MKERPPRKKVDLRVLPVWMQYLIAILTAGLVFGLVYLLQGNQPTPDWVNLYVIEKPWLGAVGLMVLFAFIWIVRKLTR